MELSLVFSFSGQDPNIISMLIRCALSEVSTVARRKMYYTKHKTGVICQFDTIILHNMISLIANVLTVMNVHER